jgi:hypothetical protein
MKIDRLTLEALVRRAEREAPRDSAEHHALADAREALDRDFQEQFPTSENEQLTLFDASDYDDVEG